VAPRDGADRLTLSTAGMPSGNYEVVVSGEGGVIERRRVVIAH
jgi:hypothetical protein